MSRNKGYLKALENYVAQLENSLIRMKETNSEDSRQIILDSLPLGSLLDLNAPQENQTSVPSIVNSAKDQIPQFYDNLAIPGNAAPSDGPLSVIKTRLASENNKKYSTVPEGRNTLSRSPYIILSLSLFFRWLYPSHYFFVYREALLSAFFQDRNSKSYYCSEELIYAVAALGSKITNKSDELYLKSFKYYSLSREIILRKIFQAKDCSFEKEGSSSPKLALIQSLLCLAFYDIGRGENSSAWYFSGLAFRIVHEIGLQLNPAALNGISGEELTQMDIEVRVRIYWGCYLVDHFIAELYGRSTVLTLSNSAIPETDELPNIKAGFEDYMYSDPDKPLLVAAPIKCLILLSRITELYKNENTQLKTTSERIGALSGFNIDLQKWRSSLPKELTWSNETLAEEKDFDPTISFVWYHYYMILLSYNKTFILDSKENTSIIEEAIQDLFYLLRDWIIKYHTFEKCSIQMVTTAVLALQCMNSKNISCIYYNDFTNFLKSPTINYDFLSELFENEISSESLYPLSLSDGANFLADEFPDLSLLSEMDALINNQVYKL
ncbi:uncharacterized protein SKDI_10G3610 [Saccharomyces kudriavzevii IFO 1802]|uniref:Xylanolytic transcriptional activator regulatory domain-containing protein n=2 Tax=Saccharomyces kudriavzevii (strain ATCC MYA-4449 / AS 2.2408 / CBS 8840 / NBRC 1802 / NCYC 2889) TaxID=226230 RepID=J4U0Z9_SACK1|nr:uncharacterized protein SKDI_10G3610 [Saccharomyces kudriavzevii IFO 1802]EJT43780.1 hypothetical protein SKUD_204902 [Saccharomyces kudriavzevii IFO 1802]CAI4044096.1 hypothetical protein SKDI_10G3610 [Saccharomyces kudriavzevii IFO 1802]